MNIIKIAKSCRTLVLASLFGFSADALSSNYSIYAAYVNEEIEDACLSFDNCELNLLQQEQFESVIVNYLGEQQKLTAEGTHAHLLATLQTGEYELLAGSAKFNAGNAEVSQIEYTLNWRGIPIFEITTLQNGLSLEDAVTSSVKTLVEEIEAQHVLHPQFLFQQVKASDYFNELSMPENVAGFYRQQMQLQQDPTRGTLVRYEHEQFPSAIVDVYVYPIVKHDYQDKQQELMYLELTKDLQVIEAISEHRDIQTINIGEISSIENGMVFEVQADDGIEEMFTSQYIFVQEDKFIKFSANMPAQFSDAMVQEVMSSIAVPPPSEIMNAFRDVDRAFSTAPVQEYADESDDSEEATEVVVTAAL
jgi:hypothetical protein